MSWIRQSIKQWLLRRDTILSHPAGQFNIFPVKLKKAHQRGLRINMAVDGGAADGGWARDFKAVFPESQILAIEPRAEAQADLQQLQRDLPGIHLAQTLIGDSARNVSFNVHGEQSSIFQTTAGTSFGTQVTASMVRLDDLVESMKLPWPDLIKLDLQGAELQALEGAPRSMAHAQMVSLEVSFMAFQSGWPLLAEVVSYMKQRNYVCYDIGGLWHRPLDGALAQGDFMFLKQDHPLLKDHRWGANDTWTA